MLRPFAILPTMMILVACLIVAEWDGDLGVRLFLAVPLWVGALLLGLPGLAPEQSSQSSLVSQAPSEHPYTTALEK